MLRDYATTMLHYLWPERAFLKPDLALQNCIKLMYLAKWGWFHSDSFFRVNSHAVGMATYGHTAFNSIFWWTFFVDQLHDFLFWFLNSFLHQFLKSKNFILKADFHNPYKIVSSWCIERNKGDFDRIKAKNSISVYDGMSGA